MTSFFQSKLLNFVISIAYQMQQFKFSLKVPSRTNATHKQNVVWSGKFYSALVLSINPYRTCWLVQPYSRDVVLKIKQEGHMRALLNILQAFQRILHKTWSFSLTVFTRWVSSLHVNTISRKSCIRSRLLFSLSLITDNDRAKLWSFDIKMLFFPQQSRSEKLLLATLLEYVR